MRQYEFTADAETIAALQALRRPWAQYSADEYRVDVRLVSGEVVRIDAEGEDVEPLFECFRLRARVVGRHGVVGRDAVFADGADRVTLLRIEEWITAPDGTEPEGMVGRVANIQSNGRPGARPWLALAACLVDDGVLLEAHDGARMLVHCEVMPCLVAATRDAAEIEQYLSNHESVELSRTDT